MPVPRRRATSPWGYTLPCEVRGAFIRVLGGILLRRGASRACLTTLHQFCATPTPPPLCARGAQPRNGSTAVVRPRRAPLAGGSPQRPRRPSALLALRPGAGYVGPRPFTSQGCRRPLVRRGCPWAPLAPRPPRPTHIDTWALLQAQPHMAYGLKYCRLSRRVRKILRNRYRYSKYFFMVPPAKRLAATLHLWKYALKFYDDRTFGQRLLALGATLGPSAPRDEGLLWPLFYAQQRLALKRLLGR